MPTDPGEVVREVDPLGRVVRLTSDQWRHHILPRHPDIAAHLPEIPWVIRQPDVIRQDALQRHRQCYYRQHLRPSGRPILLKVIVDVQPHAELEGFVVTCFLTTRLKPGEEVIWSPST